MSKRMCAQDSVPQPVENGGPNFPPAEAKHGQVLRGCKELSFSHSNTLGEEQCPRRYTLARTSASAWRTRGNPHPNYPRRFLQDVDPSEGNFSSSLENSLLSLIRCPEERWHQLQTWNTPLFLRHSPLIVASKILGWPFELNLTSLPTLLTEGPSLVMSIFPRKLMQNYNVISHSSRLIRGLLMVASIFAPNTPRRALQSSTKPWLGFVQGLPDRFNILRFKTLLITGLAVESPYHRRGFGRGPIFAVVCRMWDCEDIWIAVHEENYAMFSLYSKCGFGVRKRHWDLSMEISNM